MKSQVDEDQTSAIPSSETKPTPELSADQRVRHVTQEGARFHVISWDGKGRRCSEPRCEVNHGR